jgi:hypothetical protein
MNPLKYWNPNEFEISSFKFKLDERKNKIFKTSGSDNTNLCTYTYNELGFRGDSIKKEGFKVMSLGCSITEGVGVNDNETWPYQFTSLIPAGVDMNFGTGGRSNDFICRCLLTYYDVIKPDLVLIMYTFLHRREIYTEDGGIEPFIPSLKWGYMEETNTGKIIQNNLSQIQNDNEDFINWYKNHQLIKLFLESKKSNWGWNGTFLKTDYTDENRFDGNYTNFIDVGVDNTHPGPKHNAVYANHLYHHFKDKKIW